jgi:exopolysaccharide biosynthesis WecB/TagA/CpsF family protein
MRTQGTQRGGTSFTPDIPAISIMGVGVHKLGGDDALSLLEKPCEANPRMLAYVNAHTLNLAARDEGFRGVLNKCYLVVNDGLGISLAARMREERFLENLNGSDFTERILNLAAHRQWGVYLLGAEPGIAESASRRLASRIEGLRIVGTCHGFTGDSDESLVRRIRETGASLLIVALGSPAQEMWLDRNLQATGADLGVGVGAFLDFSAGKVMRAPRWVRVLGMEWCFRLLREPGRLWRRYIFGNPLFLIRAWRGRHEDVLSSAPRQPELRESPVRASAM